MSYCPSCGSPHKEDAKFCRSCGAALQENLDTQQHPNIPNEDHAEAPIETPVETALENTQVETALESTQDEVAEMDDSYFVTSNLTHEETAGGLQAVRRKVFTKLTISVGIGVIVLCAVSLFIFQLLGNLSPKQLYLLSERNTIEDQSESIEASFASEAALKQMLDTRPSTTKSDLGMDVTFTGAEDFVDFSSFRDVLQESRFSLLSVRDPKNEQGRYTLSYLLKDKNILDGTYVHNKESYGLEVPELLNDILFLKKSDFGKFMKEINPDYEEKEEDKDDPTVQQFLDIFSLTPQQKERINNDYTKFIIDNLEDEYFTLTEDVNYSSPDGQKQLNRIDISLTEEEIQKFIVKLIDQVRADKELHAILAQKYADLNTLSESTGRESNFAGRMEDLKDVEYIKEQIEDSLYEMRKGVSDFEYPEGFKMTVWINDKKHIVDRQIDFEVEEKSSNTGIAVKFHTSNWESKGNKQLGSIDVELSTTRGPKDSIEFHSEIVGSTGKSGVMKDIKATLISNTNEDEELNLELDLTVLSSGSKGTENTEYGFELRIDVESNSDIQPTIKGKLKRIIDQNLDKDYAKQEYIMELAVSANNPFDGEEVELGIKLELKNDVQFNDEVTVKDPESKNALHVGEMSSEDWEKLLTELSESIGEFIEKNENIFNITDSLI
jgi:hypothetical protein